MLNQDMTLGERIQTLFREQGITITSVITALGLAIGMIINSILSAFKTTAPTPPAPTPNQHQSQLLSRSQLHQLQSRNQA